MRIKVTFYESPRSTEYCYVFGFFGPRRSLPLIWLKDAVSHQISQAMVLPGYLVRNPNQGMVVRDSDSHRTQTAYERAGRHDLGKYCIKTDQASVWRGLVVSCLSLSRNPALSVL